MKPNFFLFLVVIILLGLIIWRVVFQQLVIIEEPTFFLMITGFLLIGSIFSSLMESALSVISKDEYLSAEVSKEKKVVMDTRNTKLEEMKNSPSGHNTKKEISQLKKMRRKALSLNAKEYIISKEGRGVAVGTFASASVFLNAALAIFLPLSLNSDGISGLVGIHYPWPAPTSEDFFNYKLEYWDLTGSTLFNFVVVSLPLLIFGKIIPKHVGMQHYKFFGYDWNCGARIVLRLLGWLAAGVLWFAYWVDPIRDKD